MTVLTVKQLSKSFGNTKAVTDVNFQLKKHAIIALIGPNGAGKTTILKMLVGRLKKSAGHLTFDEEETEDPRTLIGYLPQQPVFHSWMTGEEFLIYCGRLAHLSKDEAKNRTKYLLKRVGMTKAKNKRISTYSGGMKQRIGIAQALIHKPKLILLDEPVSALDPIGRRDILTLMEQLKEETTILFSTHILSDAEEVSDDVLLLHDGKLVESGTMNDLRNKYKTTKIELQFDNNIEENFALLTGLPSVISGEIVQNTIHFSVKNIETARKELLQSINEHNLSLTNFTINQASLEQMFMKVVKK